MNLVIWDNSHTHTHTHIEKYCFYFAISYHTQTFSSKRFWDVSGKNKSWENIFMTFGEVFLNKIQNAREKVKSTGQKRRG